MVPMALTPYEQHKLERLKYLRELQQKVAFQEIRSRPWFTGDPEAALPNGEKDLLNRPARPDQLPPDGDEWGIWLALAGRGWGKTRVGAETVVTWALEHPKCLTAVIGKKWTQVRDTAFAAIIEILERDGIGFEYNKGDLELFLDNGSTIRGYSGESPDTVRGANFHYAWVDEIAFIQQASYLWHDCLIPAVRKGEARIIATTTGRPTPLLKELIARRDGRVVVTRGKTFDNEANLSPATIAELKAKYEGTKRGRQELYGDIVEDVDGALWTVSMTDTARVRVDVDEILPHLATVAVGVDPAGRSSDESDETGIVVCANTGPLCPICHERDPQGHLVVIEDASGRMTPTEWAQRATRLFHKYKADYIVAEQNNGWDMVNTVIAQADRSVPIRKANATRGKYLRAEPVSVLYTSGRAHHLSSFSALEEQMQTYTPDARWSPDRLDAFVWAATYLMVRPKGPRIVVR